MGVQDNPVTDRIPQEDITDRVTPEVVETLCQYLYFADQAYDCGTENNLKKLLEEHGEPVLHAKPLILYQHLQPAAPVTWARFKHHTPH